VRPKAQAIIDSLQEVVYEESTLIPK